MGAGEAFFRDKLNGGACLVILDGLDEAPERRMRERIARIFERATRAFEKCDFLVSTRPQTNVGDSVLADFNHFRIGDLELSGIRTFFDHFAQALALTDGIEEFQGRAGDGVGQPPRDSRDGWESRDADGARRPAA